MKINEYQQLTEETAIYNGSEEKNINGLTYTTLGLCGESGEFAEKVKKILRDNNNFISNEKREELKKELGDVFWYLAQCAKQIGFTLEEVAQGNIDKLRDRKKRNMIGGSGDNR